MSAQKDKLKSKQVKKLLLAACFLSTIRDGAAAAVHFPRVALLLPSVLEELASLHMLAVVSTVLKQK